MTETIKDLGAGQEAGATAEEEVEVRRAEAEEEARTGEDPLQTGEMMIEAGTEAMTETIKDLGATIVAGAGILQGIINPDLLWIKGCPGAPIIETEGTVSKMIEAGAEADPEMTEEIGTQEAAAQETEMKVNEYFVKCRSCKK